MIKQTIKMFNEQKSTKIDYITFLQSFAVTLVIIGHCLPKANIGDIYPTWANILHTLVYSFHMPLFFVIGGFLLMNSFYKQSKSIEYFKNFFISKFKRLIIPYCAIGTLAYLLKIFVFNKYAYHPAETNIKYYLKAMLIPWDNPNIYLWFLPTMFFVLLTGYLVLKGNNYKNINSIKLLIPFFVISLLANYTQIPIFNVSGVLYYLFFFFLGVLLFKIKDSLFSYLCNIGIILILLLFFIEYFTLPVFNSGLFNYLLKYIVAVCGILLSCSLALYFTKKNKKFLYGFIDGKYYQIYLLSWFFQCGSRIFYQIHLVNYPTVCIIMFISSFIFPLLVIYLIKRFIPILKVFIGL